MHMMFAFQRGRSAGPMGRSGGESHASVVSEWHAAALAWAWAPRAPHAEICCDFFREPLDCKLGTGVWIPFMGNFFGNECILPTAMIFFFFFLRYFRKLPIF
jgi:hypothetical protein